MIVCGDPSYEAELDVLVARLQTWVTELADAGTKITLSELDDLMPVPNVRVTVKLPEA